MLLIVSTIVLVLMAVPKDVKALLVFQRFLIMHEKSSKLRTDCPIDFCTCRDLENDPNFIACESYMYNRYIACIIGCQPGDYPCTATCNREYEENLKHCPCNENCSLGCPCPNYACEISTTQATSTTALAPTTSTTTPATTPATTQ